MRHDERMRRVQVIVRGDVQGVGYRYTARVRAHELSVAGWVRNRADGTVEAELEGDPAAVATMLEWMRQGPPGARVTEVATTEVAPAGDAGFHVRG